MSKLFCGDFAGHPIPEDKTLRDAAQLALETLQYVIRYVEHQGLSAEEDCQEAIDALERALAGEKNND